MAGGFIKSLGGLSLVWLLLAGAGGYYAYKAGNEYGSYARAYRSMAKELEAKNKELEIARTDDETQIPILEAARDTALKGAIGIKTCPATKDVAKHLNAIRDGG